MRIGVLGRSLDGWLLLVVALGTTLRFSRLGDFDLAYYTATVASMLESPRNFLFASFDPGGAIMVDKPPVPFWVQSIPSLLFGVSGWSVTLPQAIAGTLAVLILYLTIKPAFGRLAALSAAAILAVTPASVVIDSSNELDSLLSFVLLLAACCIVTAARTGQWRWLLAFAMVMGIAFNTKMLAGFVPLPAFLLYYALAAHQPARQQAIRLAAAAAVLLLVSFSWVTLVALTPAEQRPYVGATQDNSIWTLVFEYNGVKRFTGFIGARPRGTASGGGASSPQPAPPQPTPQGPATAQGGQRPGPGAQPTPQGPATAQGGQRPGPGAQPTPQGPATAQGGQRLGPGAQPTPQGTATAQGGQRPGPGAQGGAPPAINPEVADAGLLGLLAYPMAGQLGGLLLPALLALLAISVPLLSEEVYRRPAMALALTRDSPILSQSILWGGWLTTAVLVYGLANATITHPYYLVALAVPTAAVLGLGLSLLVDAFRQGRPLAWLLPGALLGGGLYQVYSSRGSVGDWTGALVLVVCLLAGLILFVALGRGLTREPLATASVATGALALLVVPLGLALSAGGPTPGAGSFRLRPASASAMNPLEQRMQAAAQFLMRQGDLGSVYALGTVNAREAAPFIVAGVPALAIGGFSGNDPVFTVDSFRALAARGELRYFLMPTQGSPGGPVFPAAQESILDYIRTSWEDVSRAAGLPLSSLYRYSSER